ncbi:MAG TPA: NUDIX domain-containing protein [Actinomycetes bacterium]|nr:NUDIX domain-containing protein [Actinomycetes bacterium]
MNDDQAVSTHLCGWVVLQRPDRSVLLARRSGVPYGDGLWGLPGGHARRWESWADAAARETLEEVGVTVSADDLLALGVQRYVDGQTHGVDAYFLTTNWLGEPAAVSECSEVAWFGLADLPQDALPWLARTLDIHLSQGVWLDEVFTG